MGEKEGDYLALLRGINVGGKNKLAMKDLAAVFEKAGCRAVRTHIQSGNVLFKAPAPLAGSLAGLAEKALLKGFGLKVPVVLRSAAQLKRAVEANPFVKAGADPATLHVAFLSKEPERGAAARLEADRSPGDSFELKGAEIHLRCPGGLARSRLTNAYFDSRLGLVSTLRNWNTVRKLLELLTA